MPSAPNDQLAQVETTCGTLLCELQEIWDEMGEPDDERDKMLLQLEQECLEVYRRKVDRTNRERAQLHQAIADYEAELANIYSALGERPPLKQSDKRSGTLKEQLAAVTPLLEEMRNRKEDRVKKLQNLKAQIQKLLSEIDGHPDASHSPVTVEQDDLTIRVLEEHQTYLQALQKEKSDRLHQVIDHVNTIHGLCLVLGLDFRGTINEVHPSLDGSEQSTSVSNDTLERLSATITALRQEKRKRMQKLQDLATTMLELWNLMDTPLEEQQKFQDVTCNIAASENEINAPNALSTEFIKLVEAEVARLEEFKGSKMKELVFKKRSQLEEICRKTHLIAECSTMLDNSIASMESGLVDPCDLLETIEDEIARTKEEAFSRKEILEKVEKWMTACEEEIWLEDYNKDENRYNAGKGSHLILKRAERARTAVNKLPSMVDCLINKTVAWEKERDKEFLYDGVRLLQMLDDYNLVRQEKEQEKRRQRDQKKLQGQLIAEQEALYGSKRSPAKPISAKKITGRPSISHAPPANRRLSLQPTSLDLGPSSRTTMMAPRQQATNVLRENKKDRIHQENTINNYHSHNGASGRRISDVSGFASSKPALYLSTGQENDHNFYQATPGRNPLSPVSTPSAIHTNSNSYEDKHATCSPKKVLPVKPPLPAVTPLRTIASTDEENTTPRNAAKLHPATTPGSTAMILATPLLTSSHTASKMATCNSDQSAATEEQHSYQQLHDDHENQPHAIEYSFEERRLGFVLPEIGPEAIV